MLHNRGMLQLAHNYRTTRTSTCHRVISNRKAKIFHRSKISLELCKLQINNNLTRKIRYWVKQMELIPWGLTREVIRILLWQKYNLRVKIERIDPRIRRYNLRIMSLWLLVQLIWRLSATTLVKILPNDYQSWSKVRMKAMAILR